MKLIKYRMRGGAFLPLAVKVYIAREKNHRDAVMETVTLTEKEGELLYANPSIAPHRDEKIITRIRGFGIKPLEDISYDEEVYFEIEADF